MARSPASTPWPMCSGSPTRIQLSKRNVVMSDRLLVLVRHGQSDWNLKNLFTGWKDPDLTEQGIAEAKAAGRKLKEQRLSCALAFTPALTRAQHTLKLMLDEIGQPGLPTTRNLALNERDYGDLS